MKTITLGLCMLGVVSAAVITERAPLLTDRATESTSADPEYFNVLAKDPQFFTLHVDSCTANPAPELDDDEEEPDCPIFGSAVVLNKGKVYAKEFDATIANHLPTFFVDDDTRMYTVSKRPLAFFVDQITGALSYSRVGWTPPTAIAVGFHHLGSNPDGSSPSASVVTWPTTVGGDPLGGEWLFCQVHGSTRYQIYADPANFPGNSPSDVPITYTACLRGPLAAWDANPWTPTRVNIPSESDEPEISTTIPSVETETAEA